MNPVKINIHPQELAFPQLTQPVSNPVVDEKIGSFKDTLSEFVNSVNELQKTAGETEKSFIKGETSDIHQVMIAIEEASVAFELLMEIRNKLLESYQQLIRMPM